jgi:RNA polymerase sigma-70 factor (ECF subfamily)
VGIAGELADFGAFYGRTYARAFAVAYGVTGESGLAEDVTQDAFVVAFRRREQYRGDGPVDAWLYRIVVNTATSALRRRRVRQIVPIDPFAEDLPAPCDTADSALDVACLSQGLRQLDVRSRSAVVLRYYLDLDYAAIARVLDTSTSNVGVILTRARDRLRSLIESESRDAPFRNSAARGAAWHG